MSNERAILCGDASAAHLPLNDPAPLRLKLGGSGHNVNLRIDEIQQSMVSSVPPRFLDLIEVATYVYCADQAIKRGGAGVDRLGENWRRKLFFRIPVRDLDFWNDSSFKGLLRETLGFLSDDEYQFEFTHLKSPPPFQEYLGMSEEGGLASDPEEVILFSGGLDSLAGAIQEAVIDKRRVALVTHMPTRKLEKRHGHLRELLKGRCGGHAPMHIPVSINKDKALGREYTQRSRSFLYAILGGTVARMLGHSRVRFYENGVVSLNLPPSSQIVGAKATRTTHPQSINGFARVLSAVAESPFTVENPFLWKTKTEVLELIGAADCSELVKYSTSCTHTWEMTRLHTHCGTCSQCIDRRFAVLASGLGDADPKEAYGVDLLTDPRDEGEPRTMLAAYVETASAVTKMSPLDFFSKFGEVSRAVRHIDGSPDSTALKIFELYQRHARSVTGVVDRSISEYATAIRQRTLPPTCLLRLVCDASAPEATQPTTEAKLGDYMFRRKGEAWVTRYKGGPENIILPTKGMAYLHVLLSNPRTEYSAVSLALQVAKNPTQYALGGAGEAVDKDALSAYRARYLELEEEMAEARGNNDLAQESRVRQEMEMLKSEIQRDQGLGGRIRKEADDRERVRKAVRNAIRRAIEKIGQYDKALAEHLTAPRIQCGTTPCYLPDIDIEWDT